MSDNARLSYLASYVILDCKKGLKPKHLPALKVGWKDDGDWLPNAIASLKTDEATQFLVKKFRTNPQRQGQLDWALTNIGTDAVKLLMIEFKAANPESEKRFFSCFRHILKEVEGKGKIILPDLMSIAESQDCLPPLRKEAVLTVGSLGGVDDSVLDRLEKLAETKPNIFKEAVIEAIINNGGLRAAQALADKIDQSLLANADADKDDPFFRNNYYSIYDIAHIGTAAREVGPRVMKWLNHPEIEARVMAVRTLGAIGYQEAEKELIPYVSEVRDWRFAYAAVMSLADLKSQNAIPQLKKTAQTHWNLAVRKVAGDALIKINTGKYPPEADPESDENSFSYEAGGYFCEPFTKKQMKKKWQIKGSWEHDISLAELISLHPKHAKLLKQIQEKKNTKKIKVDLDTIFYPIEGGLFIGTNRGEWGGELFFINSSSPEGTIHVLSRENVVAIVKWKGDIYVATGIAHMYTNDGMLYKVSKQIGTSPAKIDPIFTLPGCPTRILITKDNKLIINGFSGLVEFTDFKSPKHFLSPKRHYDENADPFGDLEE